MSKKTLFTSWIQKLCIAIVACIFLCPSSHAVPSIPKMKMKVEKCIDTILSRFRSNQEEGIGNEESETIEVDKGKKKPIIEKLVIDPLVKGLVEKSGMGKFMQDGSTYFTKETPNQVIPIEMQEKLEVLGNIGGRRIVQRGGKTGSLCLAKPVGIASKDFDVVDLRGDQLIGSRELGDLQIIHTMTSKSAGTDAIYHLHVLHKNGRDLITVISSKENVTRPPDLGMKNVNIFVLDNQMAFISQPDGQKEDIFRQVNLKGAPYRYETEWIGKIEFLKIYYGSGKSSGIRFIRKNDFLVKSSNPTSFDVESDSHYEIVKRTDDTFFLIKRHVLNDQEKTSVSVISDYGSALDISSSNYDFPFSKGKFKLIRKTEIGELYEVGSNSQKESNYFYAKFDDEHNLVLKDSQEITNSKFVEAASNQKRSVFFGDEDTILTFFKGTGEEKLITKHVTKFPLKGAEVIDAPNSLPKDQNLLYLDVPLRNKLILLGHATIMVNLRTQKAVNLGNIIQVKKTGSEGSNFLIISKDFETGSVRFTQYDQSKGEFDNLTKRESDDVLQPGELPIKFKPKTWTVEKDEERRQIVIKGDLVDDQHKNAMLIYDSSSNVLGKPTIFYDVEAQEPSQSDPFSKIVLSKNKKSDEVQISHIGKNGKISSFDFDGKVEKVTNNDGHLYVKGTIDQGRGVTSTVATRYSIENHSSEGKKNKSDYILYDLYQPEIKGLTGKEKIFVGRQLGEFDKTLRSSSFIVFEDESGAVSKHWFDGNIDRIEMKDEFLLVYGHSQLVTTTIPMEARWSFRRDKKKRTEEEQAMDSLNKYLEVNEFKKVKILDESFESKMARDQERLYTKYPKETILRPDYVMVNKVEKPIYEDPKQAFKVFITERAGDSNPKVFILDEDGKYTPVRIGTVKIQEAVAGFWASLFGLDKPSITLIPNTSPIQSVKREKDLLLITVGGTGEVSRTFVYNLDLETVDLQIPNFRGVREVGGFRFYVGHPTQATEAVIAVYNPDGNQYLKHFNLGQMKVDVSNPKSITQDPETKQIHFLTTTGDTRIYDERLNTFLGLLPKEIIKEFKELGSSLGELLNERVFTQGKQQNFVDREIELGYLRSSHPLQSSLRKGSKYILIKGDIGSGRSSMLKTYIADYIAGIGSENADVKPVFFQLDPSKVSAGTQMRGSGQDKWVELERVSNELSKKGYQLVLIVDDADSIKMETGHRYDAETDIFGQIVHLKEKTGMDIIVTASNHGWDFISKNAQSFVKGFQEIRLDPKNKDETISMIKKSLELSYPGVRVIDDGILEYALDLISRLNANEVLPGPAFDIVNDVVMETMERRKYENKDLKVTKEDINKKVAGKIGLPELLVSGSTDDANKFLEGLKRHLLFNVKGQPEAVDAIVDALSSFALGINQSNVPITSAIELGPTGVGKTSLVRATAEYISGGPSIMKIIDGAEYPEGCNAQQIQELKEEIAKHIRQNPFNILLIDEMEKMGIKPLLLLLSILDGEMTEGGGGRINTSMTMLITTSNLGQGAILRENLRRVANHQPRLDRETRDEIAYQALLEFYKNNPEMIGRFRRKIYFNPLPEDVLAKVVQSYFKKHIEPKFKARNIFIEYDETFFVLVGMKFFSPDFGARGTDNQIATEFTDKFFSRSIREKKMVPGKKYLLKAILKGEDQIEFSSELNP